MSVSGLKAYASVTQTPAVNTWTPVTFDSEEWDTDGFHEPVTNPTWITIPSTGYYDFYFSSTIVTADVGWGCAFRVNGSGTSASPITAPNLSRPIMHSHTVTNAGQIFCYSQLHLTAGDHVQVMVYLYTSAAIGIADQTNYPEDASTVIVQYMGS